MARETPQKALWSARGRKVNEHILIDAITQELGVVVATLLGGSPTVDPNGTPAGTAAWMVKYTVHGPLEGSAQLLIPVDDAAKLTSTVLGFEEAPPDDAVIDNLQEIAKQIAGSLNISPDLAGIKLSVDDPATRQSVVAAGAIWVGISVGDLEMKAAVLSALVAVQAEASKTASKPAPAPAPALTSPVRADGPPPTTVPPNLDLILDMDLPLWVRFGWTNMTLQSLAKLGPGTTVDLERAPDDPVEVLVNNIVIARGEVVVVSGNYGVRVTEVVSAQDRIRSMGPAN